MKSRDEAIKTTAKRRKRRKKTRLIGGFIFLLLISLLVGVALSLTVLFPVKNVTASGSKLYSNEDIIEISGITGENNLFVLSEEAVSDNLHRSLPYIDTVKLERKIPDTIHIKVTDAEEYACYNLDGIYYAVSKNGYVLNSYEELPENTFEIFATKVKCKVGYEIEYLEKEEEKEIINEIIENLKKEEILINKIDVTGGTSGITLRVENRFDVILGSNTDIDRKIAHLSAMIDAKDEQSVGTINLSMWTKEDKKCIFTPKKAE